jgi:hypothetical protein
MDELSYTLGFGSGVVAGFVLDHWMIPVFIRAANILTRRRNGR